MLFGANTTKPDVHICRFVRNTLNRPVTDVATLEILEQATRLAGVRIRDLDTTIWEASARHTSDSQTAGLTTSMRPIRGTCSGTWVTKRFTKLAIQREGPWCLWG